MLCVVSNVNYFQLVWFYLEKQQFVFETFINIGFEFSDWNRAIQDTLWFIIRQVQTWPPILRLLKVCQIICRLVWPAIQLNQLRPNFHRTPSHCRPNRQSSLPMLQNLKSTMINKFAAMVYSGERQIIHLRRTDAKIWYNANCMRINY